MASPTLCRSLGLLKQDLCRLKVDDKLLKRMQKWDCLTPKHVQDLQEKPEAKRLDSMMQCLEKRGPSKWSLLVCVLLEVGQGKMAKSTWLAVLGNVKHLQKKDNEQNEAMDVWEAFVRRMSVALVLDQQPGQEGRGKMVDDLALDHLQARHRETASEIWEAIVQETVKQRYRSADDLNMWKRLVNSVTDIVSIRELKTDYGLWEKLVRSILDRLKKGEREASHIMYKYLVEKAQRVAFSEKVLEHIWEVMVDFMLQVQDSNQRYFVDDVKEVLVELLRNLLDDLESQESASYLFMLLKKSIPTFLEKGDRKTAKALWYALVDLAKGQSEDSKRSDMLINLYRLLGKLNKEPWADGSDVQEMRAVLPSGTSPMKEHQGPDALRVAARAAMASPTLCRSLGLLKQDLGTLVVDHGLLERMQKWDCLTSKHVKDLQEKPEAERLDMMMRCLEKRGPSKWSLLVCVLLEIGQGDMAKSTWRAVLEHVKVLQKKDKQNEAMDVWEAFVRRMSKALVLDQQPGQEDQGKTGDGLALDHLQARHRETASEIWKAIVQETVKQRYRSADDLNMWKILVNSVTKMVSGSKLKTDYGLWEELVRSVLDRLKKGEREASRLMYEYLVGKAQRVAFSPEVHIWKKMIDFMLQVQDSNQSYFVDDVKEVLVKLLRNLFGNHDLESASHIFDLLKDSIPSLLEKGASKTAKALWDTLVVLENNLPENSKQSKMHTSLFDLLRQLSEEERANNVPDLQEMRAVLSSGASSMKEHQSPDIDTGSDTSRPGLQSDTPLRYPMRSRSISLALVINNVDFSDTKIGRRDGSEMDELALPLLLRRLGFHVQQETNLSKDGLYRAIAAFADRPEHADADVAVLAVMTHGVNEALLGTDGEELPFQTVVDCFSNDNAPNLAGKPKWLGLHACRTKSDKGEDSDQKPDKRRSFHYSDAPATDMFITFTTLPGHEAMRSSVKGTWYVQALKDALDLPHAHTLSLSELHIKAEETMSAIWKKERAENLTKIQKHVECKSDECETCEILAETYEILEKEPKLDICRLGWTKKLYFRSIQDS